MLKYFWSATKSYPKAELKSSYIFAKTTELKEV